MSNEGKHRQDGMGPGEDEALWRLLGRARTPEVGPYFSRRVLRETARLDEQLPAAGTVGAGAGGLFSWLRRTWRRPGAAVWPGAVAVAVFWLSVEWTVPASRPGGAGRGLQSDGLSAGADAQTAAAMMAGVRGDAEAAAAPAGAIEDTLAPQDVEVIADLDDVISREENRLWTDDAARF